MNHLVLVVSTKTTDRQTIEDPDRTTKRHCNQTDYPAVAAAFEHEHLS